MANTRKRKKINRRVVRKSPDPLSKLDVFMITKHEIYRAAKKAGFSNEVAWFFMQEPNALPDWIANDKPDAIIPATKYWLKVTPSVNSFVKTEPKIPSNIIGKAKVNTTDSRWRINCLSSRPPRAIPMVSALGTLF